MQLFIEPAARPKRALHLSTDRQEEEGFAQEDLYEVKESADPEARWLKKGKRSYYGYKEFVRTAKGTGFIQNLQVRPAHGSETKNLEMMLEELPPGQSLYADKAYSSQANSSLLQERGIKNIIMIKATRNNPLSFW